jgi:hypothetical protein
MLCSYVFCVFASGGVALVTLVLVAFFPGQSPEKGVSDRAIGVQKFTKHGRPI